MVAADIEGNRPLLAVVIVARGLASPLLDTLDSLARQREPACEILVIDDGLDDDSAAAARRRADPRIRITRTASSLGDVPCLQLAVAETHAELILLVRPGEILMRDALRAVYDACVEAPGIGLVHSWWFALAPAGQATSLAFRRQREHLAAQLPAGIDHRRAMLVRGNLVQALPTFRREFLNRAGGFTGASCDEAIYGAVLRILNHARARVLPRLLCGRPVQEGAVLRVCGPRPYWRQVAQCYRVVRAGEAKYLWPWHRFIGLVVTGIIRNVTILLPARPRFTPSHRAAAWYRLLVALLSPWRFRSLQPSRRRPRPIDGSRVAYVQWKDPLLTETFVRREIQALAEAGLAVQMFGLVPAADAHAPNQEALRARVSYFGPPDAGLGRSAARHFLRQRPWTVLRLRLLVTRHRYRADKTWRRDAELFGLAAQLALALEAAGITHVHSPWADRSALLGMIAAGLLGITFSVQARASEIHRTGAGQRAADVIRFADFVITNSEYNERYLCSLLPGSAAPPIHRIYNGIDLGRFPPRSQWDGMLRPIHILAVGRLVEPKGFRYLLQALAILRDRGVGCSCEVVGGPQDPLDTVTWIELRKLHRELELETQVAFRGSQPFSEVLRAFDRADVFALPCVRGRDGSHDITPNVVLEAMAMGLPVISTTSGALPELVVAEQTGLLVPPNDAAALADALERLARDPLLRSSLGRAARRSVEQRFDIAKNVRARLQLFQGLAPEGQHARTERAR